MGIDAMAMRERGEEMPTPEAARTRSVVSNPFEIMAQDVAVWKAKALAAEEQLRAANERAEREAESDGVRAIAALRGIMDAWSAAPIYITGEGQMRFLDAIHECECVVDSLPSVNPTPKERQPR